MGYFGIQVIAWSMVAILLFIAFKRRGFREAFWQSLVEMLLDCLDMITFRK